MEWITANWIVLAIAVPLGLKILKIMAKRTKWVGDDKIVTLLAGAWDMIKGQVPRKFTGKK